MHDSIPPETPIKCQTRPVLSPHFFWTEVNTVLLLSEVPNHWIFSTTMEIFKSQGHLIVRWTRTTVTTLSIAKCATAVHRVYHLWPRHCIQLISLSEWGHSIEELQTGSHGGGGQVEHCSHVHGQKTHMLRTCWGTAGSGNPRVRSWSPNYVKYCHKRSWWNFYNLVFQNVRQDKRVMQPLVSTSDQWGPTEGQHPGLDSTR